MTQNQMIAVFKLVIEDQIERPTAEQIAKKAKQVRKEFKR